MSDATDLRTEVRRRLDTKTLEDLTNQREGGAQDEDDDRLLAACEDAIASFDDYGLAYDGTSKTFIKIACRLVQYHLALGAWSYEHASQLKQFIDAEIAQLTGGSHPLAVTDSKIVVGDRPDNDDFDHNHNIYDDLRIGDQSSIPEVTDDPRDN